MSPILLTSKFFTVPFCADCFAMFGSLYPYVQQVVSPEDQILHPNWTGNRQDGNDLGMLKLNRPVNQTFRSLYLPSDDAEVLDAFRLYGLRYDTEVSDVDQLRGLAVVPANNCKEMRHGRREGRVSSDTICVFIPGHHE